MKKIIEKTKKERDALVFRKSISVTESNLYYWNCSHCKIAFFDDDIVIKLSNGEWRCPKCDKNIYGGGKESFDRWYKTEDEMKNETQIHNDGNMDNEEIPYKHLYWISWSCIIIAVLGMWQLLQIIARIILWIFQ